jgi:dephospho-CoA kinase
MDQVNQPPFRIAVTGTIGSGKSLIGRLLIEQGVRVLDVDEVVHSLLDSDITVQDQIRQHFGPAILAPSPSGGDRVDRVKLGRIVFQKDDERRALEKIVHPHVHKYSENWIKKQQAPIVALLIPLLFESGNPKIFNRIWSVFCEEPILRERLKLRNNLTDIEIDKRLAAQLSQSEKAARADCQIDNSGTIEETRKQVLSLLKQVRESI